MGRLSNNRLELRRQGQRSNVPDWENNFLVVSGNKMNFNRSEKRGFEKRGSGKSHSDKVEREM